MERIATIGFFDGVHKGHCYVFEHLQSEAQKRGMTPLIITFDCHPRAALQSDYMPQLLTTPDERKALLSRFGEVLVLPFAEVQEQTAAQFMRYMHDALHVRVLLMGYDHQFGSDKLRHPQDYRRIGGEIGIEVVTMGEFIDGEWHVSSTEIRSALQNGNIAVVNELLGRPYSLRGTVIHGKGLGRILGFPTANIRPESAEKMLPKPGVYAVSVTAEGIHEAKAMLNIGTNPTIGDGTLSIEVHIPLFEGDLYGKTMDIRFLRYIREEKRFDSLLTLQKQIADDISNL